MGNQRGIVNGGRVIDLVPQGLAKRVEGGHVIAPVKLDDADGIPDHRLGRVQSQRGFKAFMRGVPFSLTPFGQSSPDPSAWAGGFQLGVCGEFHGGHLRLIDLQQKGAKVESGGSEIVV